MELEIYVVDAFTNQQFKGNSAAVVPLPESMGNEWLDVDLMQRIAAENNLSETAFLKKISSNYYQIRWFSPLTEIDFCGHATLASSFVLFHHLSCCGDIQFDTQKVGTLTVKSLADGRIEMSFPNQCPEMVSNVPQDLLDGLSIAPETVLVNRQAYFAVLPNVEDVLNVTYRSAFLKKLAPLDVVVTAASDDSEYDFVSRYFWPANGGDEDPVTGSIHSGLTPYWANELNKTDLVAYQASQRGGILYCQLSEGRVLVSGSAVLYLKGTILV
ncbi:PhzF family phenazine biosynthesis protein [Vibrio rumoiensis]|uniref:Phenazine biosynthesis protein PhzF n=1 Tax=Vibrio rumoiensis 1S-45 TaxID=1188252 RepID=A0A1E5DZD5_9VIBR|nr:PhzF family phenazine biosynthesis protein [Vibrio rumoiensis]OEF23284.1 phenazine biosynthesis protein PhzF [Vibrio rumoiensis 1S-45]